MKRRSSTSRILLPPLLLLVLLPGTAAAHDPDQVVQETAVFLEEGRLALRYDTTYGEILANVKRLEADRDRNGTLSNEEERLFLSALAETVKGGLTARLDGTDAPLKYASGRLAIAATQHLQTHLIFEVGGGPLADGRHEFELTDANHPPAVLSAMRFSARAGPGGETVTTAAAGLGLTWTFRCSPDLPGDSLFEEASRSPEGAAAARSPAETDRLTGLLREERLSTLFVLSALLIAMGMGALHALSPGHGKAMVAAYLIGTRGQVRDAVILGVVVTFTHVSSVLLLGVVALFLSRYLLPQQLYPWLGVTSGVLIFGVGFWMLARRALGKPDHAHDHHHHHSQRVREAVPDDGHRHLHEHPHGECEAGSDHGPDHVHQHGHPHDHGQEHDHQHGHGHEHEHIHGHEHEHEHGHGHGPAPADGVSWSSLLALGVSGGLVPCPSALVILLAAVAMQRILFGLALIVAFSAGLAAVLILIGVLVVRSARFVLRGRTEGRWILVLPVVSAGLIMLIGVGLAVQGLLSAGVLNGP